MNFYQKTDVPKTDFETYPDIKRLLSYLKCVFIWLEKISISTQNYLILPHKLY